ncbi:MAG: DUF72 domain-containing protein [Candidatus Eremiobacteraeota bacterium]|nr:DUF72 domain-containing protein [Candidatus Eremiobacteraeota bacterium]
MPGLVIYVGTCGYSYKDWVGPFYPPATKPAEMLRYYRSRFTAVEIDSSYYGIPSTNTIGSLNKRTPTEFRFSFKAPQTVTHPPDTKASVHDDARLLSEVIAPIHTSKKLACVLLQFPNGFKRTPTNEHYLLRAIEAFDSLPLVVEFRTSEWQNDETEQLLRENDVSLCNVDLPHLEGLPHASSDATGPIGYVRFHGRNAKTWWHGTNVTRYQYLYTSEELVPWTDRVAEIDAQVRETYAFFNNHARGSAARNAEMFEELLRERFGTMWEEALAQPSETEPIPQALSLFDET